MLVEWSRYILISSWENLKPLIICGAISRTPAVLHYHSHARSWTTIECHPASWLTSIHIPKQRNMYPQVRKDARDMSPSYRRWEWRQPSVGIPCTCIITPNVFTGVDTTDGHCYKCTLRDRNLVQQWTVITFDRLRQGKNKVFPSPTYFSGIRTGSVVRKRRMLTVESNREQVVGYTEEWC